MAEHILEVDTTYFRLQYPFMRVVVWIVDDASISMTTDDNLHSKICMSRKCCYSILYPCCCLVSKGGLQCVYSIWEKRCVNQVGGVRIVSSQYMMIIEGILKSDSIDTI